MMTPGRARSTEVEFAQDELDHARVFLRARRQRTRFRGGLDLAEALEAPLRLGDDLLRQHEDVAVGERDAGARGAGEDDLREVVAGPHRRHALERGQHQRCGHGRV